MTGGPDLLNVEDVVFDYVLPRRDLFGSAPVRRALKGVGFRLADGESMGLVGESGCGKTTLARLVMGLARSRRKATYPLRGAGLGAARLQARWRDCGRAAKWSSRTPMGPR